MKIIAHVLGAFALLATAAPLAKADEPCDQPAYEYDAAQSYAPYAPAQPIYRPGTVVVQPDYYRYDRHRRWVEARRAEARREAFRHWRWRHRAERHGRYDYGRRY